MGEVYKCTKESEFGKMQSEIRTLFREADAMGKKIAANAEMQATLNSLDKNLAVQTQMLTYIVEHNQKQDARMDKQESRMDDQDQINAEQHRVMIQMSHNLTELNQNQKALANKIENIEDLQKENEDKQTIHTGELFRNFILKVALPLGIIGAVILQILKMNMK